MPMLHVCGALLWHFFRQQQLSNSCARVCVCACVMIQWKVQFQFRRQGKAFSVDRSHNDEEAMQ